MPQGTVKSFDPATGSARVLTDDLRDLPLEPAEFARSGLRELRLGQRVRFEVEEADGDDDGDDGDEGDDVRVTNLQIVSL